MRTDSWQLPGHLELFVGAFGSFRILLALKLRTGRSGPSFPRITPSILGRLGPANDPAPNNLACPFKRVFETPGWKHACPFRQFAGHFAPGIHPAHQELACPFKRVFGILVLRTCLSFQTFFSNNCLAVGGSCLVISRYEPVHFGLESWNESKTNSD